MALPIMPLLFNVGFSLQIMQQISNFWTDRCTLMEQSLADRVYEEELIDTKGWGVHSTDSLQQPYQLCLYWEV